MNNTHNDRAKKSGYVIIFNTLLFLAVTAVLLFGVVNPIVSSYGSARSAAYSAKAFYLADSGAEEALYRLKNSKNIGATQTISLSSGTSTITVANTTTGKTITVNADIGNYQKNIRINLALGTGVAFHYGIQSGEGGFTLANSSSITGNVFSAGPIVGAGNYIYGDVISAGSNGLIYGIHATGTAFSHTIGSTAQSTTIDKDAYYISKVATVSIGGTEHPNSPDQPVVPLPISDQQIADWEADALTGGILDSSACDNYNAASNTCTLSSSKDVGWKKIPFNLLIKTSSGIITVTGPIWVTGNITTQTGPTIRMDPGLGSRNVAIIADNPADRTGSGIIDIGQSTVFQGSGSPNSFIFMISQNNSGETGGSTAAITLNQGASAMVAYASHGIINLGQSVSIKEATGYKIALSQSANVTYDTGLPNVLFSAGPGGGYDLVDWTEI